MEINCYLTKWRSVKFVDDRNLIAHNYWRLTKTDIEGGECLDKPLEFLARFIERCDHWEKVLKGLLALARQAAAAREGEILKLSTDEVDNAEYYRKQVEAFLQHKDG